MRGVLSWRRLAAGAAVPVLVLAACANNGGDLDEKDSASGEWAATIESLPAVREMVEALQHERAAGALSVLGDAADTIDPSADDYATTRATTDAAIERFEAAVTDDEQTERIYGDALVSLDELTAIRTEVDRESAAGDLSNVDTARAIAESYRTVAASVTDATLSAANGIDDPDVERGARLFAEGLRQTELPSSLLFVLLQGFGEEATYTSSWLAEMASLMTQFDEGWTSIEELAADSPYEPLAETLEADLDAAGYFYAMGRLIDGDPVDADALRSVLMPRDKGWWPFLAGVERVLRGRD